MQKNNSRSPTETKVSSKVS